MLQPARRKYRKEQKGRNRGIATRGNKVSFGEYGLKATTRGRLTARQIEAARRAMSRARACSYSSSTMTPAPSPMTKPSRSLSQGREAVAGSSLRVDRAWAEAKPPTASADTVASAPPQTIASASPYSIIRADRPIACRPVVQAVTTAMLGPLRPNMIDRLPEIMLLMVPGMKKGEILRGPPAR